MMFVIVHLELLIIAARITLDIWDWYRNAIQEFMMLGLTTLGTGYNWNYLQCELKHVFFSQIAFRGIVSNVTRWYLMTWDDDDHIPRDPCCWCCVCTTVTTVTSDQCPQWPCQQTRGSICWNKLENFTHKTCGYMWISMQLLLWHYFSRDLCLSNNLNIHINTKLWNF